MDWNKLLKDLKDMPSGFFIGLGMLALAIAWAITSMAGCEAKSAEARYKHHAESEKAFWDASKDNK